MTFADEIAGDRRLIVLRALTEISGGMMNENIARTALQQFGHRVGSDIVRADLEFLDRHGLARLEKIVTPRGDLWLTKLLVAGEDVANGAATHPGVARRRAE